MSAKEAGIVVFGFFFAIGTMIWITGMADTTLWHVFCMSVLLAGAAAAFAGFMNHRDKEEAKRRRDEQERNEELVALREQVRSLK